MTRRSRARSGAAQAHWAAGQHGALQVRGGGEPIRVDRNKTPVAVLGARFTRAADVVKKVPAILYVLLGIAIGLLLAAALLLRFVPSDRIALARRTFSCVGGRGLLASVAVVYALPRMVGRGGTRGKSDDFPRHSVAVVYALA